MSGNELFELAMEQLKATSQRNNAMAYAEAVELRLMSGMDERGNIITGKEFDETGRVIKKKRGRKPKVEKVEKLDVSDDKSIVNSKPKKPKKVKVVRKKVNGSPKGKQASAPILKFDSTVKSLVKKVKLFDDAMSVLFGKKYTGTNLTSDGIKMVVDKKLTKPTEKNPNGVLLVTLENKTHIAKFYEWDKKFWMAQLANFTHYMKPLKKKAKK